MKPIRSRKQEQVKIKDPQFSIKSESIKKKEKEKEKKETKKKEEKRERLRVRIAQKGKKGGKAGGEKKERYPAKTKKRRRRQRGYGWRGGSERVSVGRGRGGRGGLKRGRGTVALLYPSPSLSNLSSSLSLISLIARLQSSLVPSSRNFPFPNLFFHITFLIFSGLTLCLHLLFIINHTYTAH